MKQRAYKFRRMLTLLALALPFATTSHYTLASPGTLSQTPLYVGPSVEPNIFFMTDDSGSMDYQLLTDEDDGVMWLHIETFGASYYPMWQPAGLRNKYVVPSEDWVADNAATFGNATYPYGGIWRARNVAYNRIYYNPEVTYKVWPGVDKNGNAFADANPKAAVLDPYDPSFGTMDLTNYQTPFLGSWYNPATALWYESDPAIAGQTGITDYYPARYYIWTDSNGDGVVDPDDAHTLVEITDHATKLTSVIPTSYPGGPNRTDCANPTSCTYAEEIQNFANWFSYYRSRDLTVKAAISAATVDLTGARIGYGTINNNASVAIGVASMNLDPTTGTKKALFDKIYTTDPGSMTPLRQGLKSVGLYYECKSGNVLGASGSSCPILPATQGGECQKNFTILMTDGYYNGKTPGLSPANADGDANTAFDGGSYADSNTNTLADVAMDFYERDLATSLPDDVPVWKGSIDQATHQHMVTYTVAFGVSGTLDPHDTKTPGVASDTDPTAAGFTWPSPSSGDPEKIDDLWHAAYNGRGEFFSAQDTPSLITGIQDAFTSAMRGQSSAAAVAFNTTTLDTGSMVFQAKFNPGEHWMGELISTNLTADGSLGSVAWNAANVLDATSPASRLILTYNESTKTGVSFDSLLNLSAKQLADLNMGPSGADGQAQARLDYLRGDRSNEGVGANFRVRSSALGDIVYSNPVFVGKAQGSYADNTSIGDGLYSQFKISMGSRPGVVYVGSNDGMLHGFSETNGSEVMAFMPNMLFSSATGEGLHYLTDPAYTHHYYADLSPTVQDVYTGSSWRTMLIGGYRAGGRGLYALDITNPSSFSAANANSTVLWEFTSNDNNNLGYSFSKPTMAQLQDGTWAAIFGNGYNDLGTGSAQLFILFLDKGMDKTWSAGDYVVIDTKVGTSGDRNGLSTPAVVDSDGDGKADRAYAGDLKGNLWAFDLLNYKVAYPKGGGAPVPLFHAEATAGVPQPITSKPVVARHPTEAYTTSNAPDVLVFFGTGQYIVAGDKSDTNTQTMYGVWDDAPPSAKLPLTRANLVAQTLQASSTASIRVQTDNTVDYASKFGWMFDFPTPSERLVVDPKIRGDYVFFNSLIPDPGVCNSQGYGWLYALKLVNGGRPDTPVFDINNDGIVNDSDKLGDSPGGVKLDGIPAGSNFLGDNMYTPDDEGHIDIRRIDAGISIDSGRLSWREVRK